MRKNLNFLRWSSLRGVGQSKAAGFTILIPLVGWAILLNDAAIEYLGMVSDLFHETKKIDTVDISFHKTSRLFTISNLYFSYFGLTLIGIASFLFRSFCPRIIKEYSTPSRYIENEERFITDASLNLLTEKTASAYLKQEKSNESSFLQMLSSRELQVQMDAVVQQMHLSESVGVNHSDGNFVTPMDTPIVENILEEVSVNRRVSRALVESFRASARATRADFMIMEYFSDDVTLWGLRIFVFAFYAIGFILLSIPTIRTLIKIITLVI